MSASRHRNIHLHLECLENRCVPATFTVTKLTDNLPADPLIKGTLRWAVDQANVNPATADTIVFKLGLEGTIKLAAGEIPVMGHLAIAGPGAHKITVDANAASRIFAVDDSNGLSDKNVSISGLMLYNGDASATGGGGAIFGAENLTLSKCILVGNAAPGGGNSGGGVMSIGDRTILRLCAIRENQSGVAGGGVFLKSITALIDRCTITGNSTVAEGGAVHVEDGNLTVRASILSGNSTPGDGGALHANPGTSLTIVSSTFTGNRADGQGGGIFANSDSLSATSTRILFNTAGSSGGGLLAVGTTTLVGCTISGNTSLAGRGGGIRQAGGSLDITSSTISGNFATASQGGGICVTNATGTALRRSTLSGNIADQGGGVWSENNILTVERSTISDNTALNAIVGGGGIGQDGGTLSIASSTISNNRAAGYGGGIHIDHTSADFVLRASTLNGNSAGGSGGGLYIGDATLPTLIQNSTMSGNRADGKGGAIAHAGTALTVQNSTIAFNRAGGSGGGVWMDTLTSVALQSTIVSNNQAPNGPDLDNDDIAYRFKLTNSLVGNSSGFDFDDLGGNLLNLDPLLAPLAFNGGPTQTHALKARSPAINKGYNPGALTTDQRGVPFKRKVGSAVDIGAYERQ